MSREKNDFSEVCYFLTFNTVDSVDIFIRPVYKQIIVHSLNHFIEHKGLSVYAWCLMTNHLHLLVCAEPNSHVAALEEELKSFTTQKIREALETEPDSRKTWILDRFEKPGGSASIGKSFQVWQAFTTPIFIELEKRETLVEYFDYIHANPVRDRVVDAECDFLYSSARDYSGIPGLVNVSKLPVIDQLLSTESAGGYFGRYNRY